MTDSANSTVRVLKVKGRYMCIYMMASPTLAESTKTKEGKTFGAVMDTRYGRRLL